jgi:signal transduction histidine kinase
MLSPLINVQYCFDLLLEQISVGLVLYSHIPTAIIALLFSIFLLFKTRNIQGKTFFALSVAFVIWSILDLMTWFAFIGPDVVMFSWSSLEIFGLLIFLSSFYFLYVSLKGKDIPTYSKIIGIISLLPLFYWGFSNQILINYDNYSCEAVENNLVTMYITIIESLVILLTVFFTINQINKNIENIKKILTMGFAVFFFLIVFSFSGSLADILASAGWSNAYNFGIYSLFGMPILLGFLGYMIVRFKTFDIKLIGSQALVWALVILVGSEFFFVESLTNQILVAITLVLSAIVGLIIVRSVKKEIAQKEELALANENQQLLIRFITHQVKGFFTKSKMVFASILEGDLGEVSEPVKNIVKEGLESDNKAVDMVQEVLNASSLRTGQMKYNLEKINMVNFVRGIAETFKEMAGQKALQYEINLPNEEIFANIDQLQMTQVFKNLIDNSIKYTPTGYVKVALQVKNIMKGHKKLNNIISFSIEDSGVGLSEGDKAKLFKEGGRGEESLKVNVNSTGYGLFIVKKIVEGHGGKIWAESHGRGHGSQFYVEVPAL